MTKLSYSCGKDKYVFDKAKKYNIDLLIGRGHKEEVAQFTSLVDENLKSVTIRKHGERSENISSSTPGICQFEPYHGISCIEMYGFDNSPYSEKNFIKHEFSHELWHSLINITNYETVKNNSKIPFAAVDASNKVVLKYPISGSIANLDFKTRKQEKKYGKMFMETTTDLLTACSYAAFDEETRRKGITVDKIFKESYKTWHNNASTGYSLFTSITRLLIAAYSNYGGDYLDNVARNGHSIFDCKVKTRTNKIMLANTYLYNFVHNPLEIEREFDRYAGHGEFERIATKLDNAFDAIIQNNESILDYSPIIKEFMIIVPKYINNKTAHYLKDNLISREDALAQISAFNKIWNSLQSEYAAYFTQRDIEEIQENANEYYRRLSLR